MKVIYVDDERSAHINFTYSIKDRAEVESAEYFFEANSALEHARKHHIDCAFLDINLPGKSGIQLGQELKIIQPTIEIVFITSFDMYARDAYKVGGRGYLSKPYSEEEFDEVLLRVAKLVQVPTVSLEKKEEDLPRIFIKTFGNFDLFIDKKPVHFKIAKAKELLAFLIDQMGGSVNNTQIFMALWEKQEYSAQTSTYVRRTVRSLRTELEELGIGHILISKRNSICIDMNAVTCDYYDLLKGKVSSANLYNGRYMSQYYWGEETIPVLDRMMEKLENNKNI